MLDSTIRNLIEIPDSFRGIIKWNRLEATDSDDETIDILIGRIESFWTIELIGLNEFRQSNWNQLDWIGLGLMEPIESNESYDGLIRMR